MTITITDPVLLDQLRRSPGGSRLLTASADPVGVTNVANVGLPPPGWESPYSEEELAERRKQRTGRPLADIMRDLGMRK